MSSRFRSVLSWVARETSGFLSKEVLKYFLVTVGAVVLGWFLALLTEVLHLQAPLTLATLQDRLIEFAKLLWSRPYDFSIGLFWRDPIHGAAALLISSASIVSFLLLRRARGRLDTQSKYITELQVDRELLAQAGIGGRWPHAIPSKPDGAPWAALCAEIQRPDNNHLYLLGANGIDTFGLPHSPLYDVMGAFRGTVRVILADPKSDETDGRAEAVRTPISEYKTAIRTSVIRLRQLRHTHHSVDGRYYNGQPNWKFIITSRTIWVQYYTPGGFQVNETPVWRFDATEIGSGLYHYFCMEFDRIWRRCEDNVMNLN